MKKFIFSTLLVLNLTLSIFAGDVAEFLSLGFSQDGKYYTFAQYGVTDKTFEPYAEIYTVDIAKNEYVPNGVFKASQKQDKTIKNGKALYEKLYAENKKFIESHSGKEATLDNTLYLRGPESKLSTEQIVFQNFNLKDDEEEVFYFITLVKNCTGSGKNLKSSFFINIEIKDENDKIISRQIAGNPSFERKNVKDYVIRRIVSSEDGKSLIFEIEKLCEDETGTSFRYMIETLILK